MTRALQSRGGGRRAHGKREHQAGNEGDARGNDCGVGGVYAAAGTEICRRRRQQPVEYVAADDRPQPRLDRMRGAGMAATVGRVRPCGLLDWKFTVLSHNTIRGAAGAALLNAELLASLGKLDPVADSRHEPRRRDEVRRNLRRGRGGDPAHGWRLWPARGEGVAAGGRGERDGEGHRSVASAAATAANGRSRRARWPSRSGCASGTPIRRRSWRLGRSCTKIRWRRRIRTRHCRRRMRGWTRSSMASTKCCAAWRRWAS